MSGESAKANEPKPFASLSSALLARKGHAKPAMRPQSFHMVPGPAPVELNGFHADHDDLGWNDMGQDLNGASPVPIRPEQVSFEEPVAPPPVVEQQEVLARKFEESPPFVMPEARVEPVYARQPEPEDQPQPEDRPEPEEASAREPEVQPVRMVRPRAAPGSKGRAAFTLRLDAERHLQLRLVCAVNHRSAQQIVTLALDEFLARQPDHAALTARHQ